MDWNKEGWDFHHFFLFGVVIRSEVNEFQNHPKAGAARVTFRTLLLLTSTYFLG
jgi:hypothetical protein